MNPIGTAQKLVAQLAVYINFNGVSALYQVINWPRSPVDQRLDIAGFGGTPIVAIAISPVRHSLCGHS